jgi:hypothetical protein
MDAARLTDGWDANESSIASPETYAPTAKQMAARGFRILKFDVDVPTPCETDEYNRHMSCTEIEFSASLIRAAPQAVHPTVKSRWTVIGTMTPKPPFNWPPPLKI